jgi:hypothetical protein
VALGGRWGLGGIGCGFGGCRVGLKGVECGFGGG